MTFVRDVHFYYFLRAPKNRATPLIRKPADEKLFLYFTWHVGLQ